MIEIVDSEYTSPHLPILNDWFSAEWGEDDFLNPHEMAMRFPRHWLRCRVMYWSVGWRSLDLKTPKTLKMLPFG